MSDPPVYVRVSHLRAMGFSPLDAERLHRRAARRHGVYKPGDRFTYVTLEAVQEAIQEAKVETT